jgi:hypothetical protein
MKRLLIFLLFVSPALAQRNVARAEIDLYGYFGGGQTNTFCAANLACTITGVWSFQANNTHSGTETFTNRLSTGNLNDILFVDGVQYTTIAAAVTAAGANTRIIGIPSTYAGTECPVLTTTLIFWDFRPTSGVIGGPCTSNVVSWNQASGSGQHAMIRTIWQKASPASSDVATFAQAQFTGTIPASSTVEGFAGEADSIGTMVSIPGSSNLIAGEGDVVLASTGQTWNNVYGWFSHIISNVGNTTNVTNAYGMRSAAYTKGGSETVTNAIGLLLDAQTAGAALNLSLQSLGAGLFDCTASAQADCLQIKGNATTNNSAIRLTNTAASGGDWRVGETIVAGQMSFRNFNISGGPYWSMAFGGTGAFGGIFTHSNTANRTYTFPDATGTIPMLSLAQSWTAAQSLGAGGSLNATSLLISPTAPTIAGAGCGGTVAAIQNANGTASFDIFTGTAPTSAGCTITLPAAAHHWHCEANHTSAISTTNFVIQQTDSGASTTSVTLQLFSDVAAATAPAASDTWRTTCTAN